MSQGSIGKCPLSRTSSSSTLRIQSLDSAPSCTSRLKRKRQRGFIREVAYKNVGAYYTSTGGNERTAGLRLSEVLRKRLKDEFGKRTIIDVVAGERSDAWKW